MKKSTCNKPFRIFRILFAVSFIVVAFCCFVLISLDSPIESCTRFVHKKEAVLTEIAEEFLRNPGQISGSSEFPELRGLKVSLIRSTGNAVRFTLDYSFPTVPLEGYVDLVYFPDGKYVPSLDDRQWISVDSASDGTLRWEADFIDDRCAYLESTQLSSCFFFEEAYLPT